MIRAGGLQLLIEQYVCIFIFLELELRLAVFILSSKAFLFYPFGVDLVDKLVVKGVPFVIWLDEGVVVPSL
jgi:hypothetical protein